MEDVSDLPFRRLCRELGADEFREGDVGAEGLIAQSRTATRKIELAPDDCPTAIQIYGADAQLLVEAAEVAAAAKPAFVDINCGCWVPRVARGGSGAAWLKRPSAMVEMAGRIVQQLGTMPVTVKTRVGWGDEKEMPIVDLARRLEDTGVAALTLHCRTAVMGHSGRADWSWAARAQAAVRIPVVVNGDIRSGTDARRALDETGAAAVMIGRAAIDSPWVFRDVRAALRGEPSVSPPGLDERRAMYARLLVDNVARRGEKFGVEVTRRHARPFFAGLPDGDALRTRLVNTPSAADSLALLG
jgi:nifR3 family TIM-barrel protein